MKLDSSVVCVVIVLGCLLHSVFMPEATNVLRELMIAAVSGYFGYLKGSEHENS
jgi:hypothetical protein